MCIPCHKTFSVVPRSRSSVKVQYQCHIFKKMADMRVLVFHTLCLFDLEFSLKTMQPQPSVDICMWRSCYYLCIWIHQYLLIKSKTMFYQNYSERVQLSHYPEKIYSCSMLMGTLNSGNLICFSH